MTSSAHPAYRRLRDLLRELFQYDRSTYIAKLFAALSPTGAG